MQCFAHPMKFDSYCIDKNVGNRYLKNGGKNNMFEIRLVTNFIKDDTTFNLTNVKVVVEDRANGRKVEVVKIENTEHGSASLFFAALKDVAVNAYSSTLLE